MSNWQRRTRAVLLVFGILFATGVYFSWRERKVVAPPPKVERSDPKAIAEMTDAQSTQSKGLRRDLDITFDNALAYEDGSMKFSGPKMVVPQRSGRTFIIRANEAVQKGEVNSAEKPLSIAMKGQVRLETSDGLDARTEEATYTEPESILRTSKAVTFKRERMSGSGTGATYDKQRDVLWLLADAVVDVKPDDQGSGALNMTAGTAGLARADRYMRLQGGSHIRRDHRNIDSAEAMIYFHQTDDRIELMELRGGVRISGGERAAGGLQDMTADSVNLNFAEDGQTLRTATLAGKGAIQLAGATGQAGRRISADWLELGFAPDGSTVTQVSARDQVALEFPAEGETPGRTVRATRLEAVGEASKGLVSARLAGNVDFREQRKGTATAAVLDRQVHAAVLELGLAPGMAGINDATFTGDSGARPDDPARHVRLKDGELQAIAPEIRYQLAAQTLALIAPADVPAASSTVNDRDMLIKARQISVALDGRKMQAEGEVSTELRPSKDAAQGKTPGMLKSDANVLASAKQLTYDGGAGTAEYTGGANILQGDTAVRADSILIDRSKGNLTAKGKVRSNMMFEDKTDPAKPEKVAAIARANELMYEEDARRLSYVGEALVSGPQGEVKADRVELFLGKTQSALDRVEAYDNVTVALPGRIAKGMRLTYFAEGGRYEMRGDPASVIQPRDEACSETTSQVLTFSKATAGVSAGDSRTLQETKDKVACPAGIK